MFGKRVRALEKAVDELSVRMVEISKLLEEMRSEKRTVSDMTKEKDKQLTFSQIVDEWMNGEDNGEK